MEGPRISREFKTVKRMIELNCRLRHGRRGELCAACATLLEYARERLEKCPFQERKTTCVNCAVHCYRAEPREQIREVMRFAGPRMLCRHPILTIWHLLDGRRKRPLPVER